MEIKNKVEKICPVCLERFTSTTKRRKPRGMRCKTITRQPNAYTCSRFCAMIYERVRHHIIANKTYQLENGKSKEHQKS